MEESREEAQVKIIDLKKVFNKYRPVDENGKPFVNSEPSTGNYNEKGRVPKSPPEKGSIVDIKK